MRFITPCLILTIFCISPLTAEGTRELAPNGSINIGGNTTTDLAALHINHPAFNNFASYTNNDPHSRLYIHVKDPAAECIYLGFSFGHLNVTSPNPTRTNFEYRVKDPAGNVVFGPVTVFSNEPIIQNWSQGFTGPSQIHGAGGYDAHQVTSANLGSQGWTGAGDYYVEFLSAGDADLLIDFWDITVADCAGAAPIEKKGRIWSYNWSIFAVNDFNFPNRPFNGAFYVCAPDPDDPERSFITKIDFNGSGFRPAAFNVAFNSFGSMNSGNIEEDRKSVQMLNSTQSEYAIFLNDPVELCETAVVGEITLHGISRCDAGDYCIKFTTSKEGQVDLLLDFDGPDDVFTPGTRDVLITYIVEAGEVGVPSCVTWDGLDGLGNPLPEVEGTQIPITISYAQGIYHFPIYDAELMTSGFMLEAVRPAASIPLLYYDDSNITVASGSGEPAIQLSGCNVPCHRWTNFVNNTVTGFGNLNTINSWWFSQRVVRQEVLLLPGYYSCEVTGPASICAGSSATIAIQPQVHPEMVSGPEVIGSVWSGPGIVGQNTGNTIEVNEEGTYNVQLTWLTGLGDTCSTSCTYTLLIDPPLEETIDTFIVQGDVLDINGELYSEAGQYVQHLTNVLGCDSILTINVKVLHTVLHYDLDACLAFMSDGSHMDYSEFTVDYPEPLSCADISATIVFREPAQMQKHSCTPGVNNSVAMCISSLDDCNYDAGNDASLVFEVTITPDPDTAVHLTGFSFFEKGPLTYDWISGDSGPNNYPTLYGLRILKNGTEIFRQEDIPTHTSWTEAIYDFLDDDDFIIEDPATFRFELLPYCLVGNGEEVAAWDIDEIYVTASCAPFEGLQQIISGVILTPGEKTINDVEVRLVAAHQTLDQRSAFTAADGTYQFTDVREGSECHITGYKNDDFLNGVSTLDLVNIQKHLLGIRPFDSPYKFIAADANRSNSISAKDLIDLRKLILGMIDELPNNTSWRFGNADDHNNGQYPWGFKESIDIEQLQYDQTDANFVGVKVGDVNGDVKTDATSNPIYQRTTDVLHFELMNAHVKAGQVVSVTMRSDKSIELTGLQFDISYDGLKLLETKDGIVPTGNEFFYMPENEIRCSWNTKHVAVDKDDELFTFVFSAERSGWLSDMLSLKESRISPEAYVGEGGERHMVEMKFNEPASYVEARMFENYPNPFSENTVIRYDVDTPGDVVMTFTDMSGKVIHEMVTHREKGTYETVISAAALGSATGVIICRMQCHEEVSSIRLIRMK